MAQYRATQSVDFFAHESLTVTSAVKSLTASTYAPTGQRQAQYAVVTVETDSVRCRFDAGTPSDTAGHLVTTSDTVELEGSNQIANFRMHRVTNDATVKVSYAR